MKKILRYLRLTLEVKYGSQKLEKVVKFLKYLDKVMRSIPVVQNTIAHVIHKYIVIIHSDMSSQSRPCEKKSCSEYQTLFSNVLMHKSAGTKLSTPT